MDLVLMAVVLVGAALRTAYELGKVAQLDALIRKD